jgi:hypothetical protein
MHQVIDRKSVYVVEFDTMPELPITGLTHGERMYANLVGHGSNNFLIQGKIRYAEALTHAIETGVISEPGKYGINLVPGTANYEIYAIQE